MFSDWQRLLELFDIERIAVEKTYMQIVEADSTLGRYYHILAHIQQVLATIQSYAADIVINFSTHLIKPRKK